MAKCYFLITLFVSLLAIDAQYCNVGELSQNVVGAGACNDVVKGKLQALLTGEAQCEAYCRQQYGSELREVECKDTLSRGKRECICKLGCARGYCYGDPHCRTFDGLALDYHGLNKHYLIKPCNKYLSLPQFEVRQTNKPWQNTNLTDIHEVELNVPEWQQLIGLALPEKQSDNYTLTVNGKQTEIPYFYSRKVDAYKEHFITVNFTDGTRHRIQLETSFGVKITTTLHPSYNYGFWSFVDVSIPRHPDLKSNSCGLLGRWNDDTSDDLIDANGKKQSPDPLWSWEFGDSWRLSTERTRSMRVRKILKLAHQDHLNKVKKDRKKTHRIQSLCSKLQDPKVVDCAKSKGLGLPTADACFTDVSYVPNATDEKKLVCGILQTFIDACNLKIKTCN